MATSGRFRSTRRLRNWMVDQVNSGRYPGLMWDDPAKTMFRIPWKHAGKQDFRSNEDAAIFKAWAEFKGKLREGARSDPASWKTRLRCALNKSPEFMEVNERSQLDISEPYKVYRLVPLDEQGLVPGGRKDRVRAGRKRRQRSNSDSSEENFNKKYKNEVVSSQPISMAMQHIEVEREITIESEAVDESTLIIKDESSVSEIQLNFMIETVPPAGAPPYLLVSVLYMGQEVLRRDIFQKDIRIAYYPSSAPQPLASLSVERVALPEPSSALSPGSCTGQQLQAFSTLLSFMEKGVILASSGLGIMAQRFCQGRVFWRGPHTTKEGPHKLERTNNPIWLFERQRFQQELDMFRSCGGAPPQCGVTLCFGEELTDKEETTSKLITVQISLPWATQQVQEAQSFRDSMTLLQALASQSPLSEVTLNLVGIL
ncbi:hypothetical protein AAFF_G00057480 [Aldrovandia affinis]|uniref:IRF tryptophan pentad repeat domain-containing protein n=1 Tax=Aldrovandia affinis TaxID=143900 RepID=A0AAD7S0N2_9TELE|nr:hypothetical protein AAFF_G00057480 [Aldrovandia affinis]